MFHTVVVGTDGSARSERAVQEAIDIARSQGARLHLVAAFPDAGRGREPLGSSAREDPVDLSSVAESLLARTARKVKDQGVEVDYSARGGHPADALIEAAEAEHADAIVVGNRGMSGGKRRFLGSVPNKVSHHAPCTVIIVRTD